jgi:hypothetical protein
MNAVMIKKYFNETGLETLQLPGDIASVSLSSSAAAAITA